MAATLRERYATAFVTGASSGLGRAFAEMLLGEGVRVWGTSRDTARLAELKARHGSCFSAVALDLADGASAERAFLLAAAEAGGSFDLVVNNAGFGVFGPFEAVEERLWRAQLDAMLGTTLRLAHAGYRAMRAKGGGCLVNVSSLAAEFPLPYLSGYNVAKAGLSALSESLIFESRGSPLIVIDLRPGDFRTSFNHAMHFPVPPQGTEKVWSRLDGVFRRSPPPERAAADLRRALIKGRSGTVRTGSFFQTRLAPVLSRLAPQSWLRAGMARYFGAA